MVAFISSAGIGSGLGNGAAESAKARDTEGFFQPAEQV
jgi:hypothetical protein